MTNEISNEQLRSNEVTAEQLTSAMDKLLFRFGQEGPDRTVSLSYILPGSEQVKIEDRPYGRLGRYEGKDGQPYYITGTVVPRNGGSSRYLTYLDGKILSKTESWEQIGTDNQERKEKQEELPQEQIQGLYAEITDPKMEPRERAIDAHYHKRHYSRTRVGRFIARARNIDRPRYF